MLQYGTIQRLVQHNNNNYYYYLMQRQPDQWATTKSVTRIIIDWHSSS